MECLVGPGPVIGFAKRNNTPFPCDYNPLAWCLYNHHDDDLDGLELPHRDGHAHQAGRRGGLYRVNSSCRMLIARKSTSFRFCTPSPKPFCRPATTPQQAHLRLPRPRRPVQVRQQ